MTDTAWEEYLAATRRLDALRRGATTAEGEPAGAAAASLEELTRVRARLAAQHTRLRALGVPEEELYPSSADLAAAGTSDGAGAPDGASALHDVGAQDGAGADAPGAVWAALHRSRALAERADAALAPPRGWTALVRWSRGLLSRQRRANAG